MKRFILLSLLFFTAVSCSPSGLRIGTFNLWRSDLGKGDYEWPVRRDRLVKAVSEVGYDLFGAEEVDTTMIRELPGLFEAAGLDYRMFIFSPYEADGGVGNKAQAMIYNPERLEMLENHHFWFSETPDEISGGWDEMKFKRGGCCAVFRDLGNGRRFFVMLSHMPLGKEANLHAATIINERAAMYNTENLPAIFIGDLNTRPDSPSSEILRTYWKDVYMTLPGEKISGPFATYNGHDTSRNLDEMPQRIDFVYFRGKKVEPLRYTNDTVTYDGFYPSDHCPVYVDFKIR